VQTGIILEVGENITQNVALQVGALTETVEVQAAASMVETKDTSISQVISQAPIVDLPLNGRNPTSLLQLSGVRHLHDDAEWGRSDGQQETFRIQRFGQFSVAGGAANGVNFLLDGGDNNDAFSNVNLPIPFRMRSRNFSVQTTGLTAQYGLHPGGVVNIRDQVGNQRLPRRCVRVSAQWRSQRPAGRNAGARYHKAQPVRRTAGGRISRTSCSSSAAIREPGSAAIRQTRSPTLPPRLR